MADGGARGEAGAATEDEAYHAVHLPVGRVAPHHLERVELRLPAVRVAAREQSKGELSRSGARKREWQSRWSSARAWSLSPHWQTQVTPMRSGSAAIAQRPPVMPPVSAPSPMVMQTSGCPLPICPDMRPDRMRSRGSVTCWPGGRASLIGVRS